MTHEEAREKLQDLLHHPLVQALLAAAGATPVHLVGGVLRDRLLGRPTRDIDAVVAGRGKAIAGGVAAAVGGRLVPLGGDRFAAYRVVVGSGAVDLWDRSEAPLGADLARRDLTVNSMALELPAGRLEDPFGGVGDLAARRLVATTEGSFRGDPLRVLRLARLLVELPGFTAGDDTMELARRQAGRITGVARERVREELERAFAGPASARGLAALARLHLYPGLWIGRPGDGMPAGDSVRLLESFEEERRGLARRLKAESGLRAHGLGAASVDARAGRLALTFLALPPPEPPRDHLQRFRDAGYLTRGDAAAVATLLAASEAPRGEREQRRFLHRAGRLWPTAAALVAACRRLEGDRDWGETELDALLALEREEGESLLDPPRLVTGHEVRELLGSPRGPEIGRALERVRQAQVDGRVRTREEAIRLLTGGGAPPRA